MAGRRQALLIATGEYLDQKLRPLLSAQRDAEELAGVLSDVDVGDFTTSQLIDEPHYVIGRSIEEFLGNGSRDDFLIVYLTGHGIRDDDGNLHFVAANTERRWLASTAVSAAFVRGCVAKCRAKAVLIVLDCCFSGAYMFGAKAGQSETEVDVQTYLGGGNGRAILTASNALEFAWEEDRSAAGTGGSVFSSIVVEGLRTGAADRDSDGRVSVLDLYEYTFDRVRKAGWPQTPTLSGTIEGPVYVARNPKLAAPGMSAAATKAAHQGAIALIEGRYEESVSYLTSALEFQPTNPSVLRFRSDANHFLEHYDDADDDLATCVESAIRIYGDRSIIAGRTRFTSDRQTGKYRLLVIPAATQHEGRIAFAELVVDEVTLRRAHDIALKWGPSRGASIIIEPPVYSGVSVSATIRVQANTDPVETRRRALLELYTFLNPLIGGPHGKGWSFGATVQAIDLHDLLARLPGVEGIEILELFQADPMTGELGPAVSEIELATETMVFSYEHRVEVVPRAP